jgi:hypothetical protein
MIRALLAFLSMLFLLAAPASAVEFNHSQWDALVKKNVVLINQGHASQANYAGFKADRAKLDAYLASTSTVTRKTFDSWSSSEQLAFLINVYNARTVELILTRYPNLKSIKELGTLVQSPWQKPFFTLLGKQESLDGVEQTLIRGSHRYNDPRIHFAVNCASIGCPALRNEAYTSARLNAQLEEQAHRFLGDKTRNRYEGGVLKLSSIFKWYGGDFQGFRGSAKLEDFLASYAADLGLSAADAQKLRKGGIKLVFTDYDWKLNSVKK